MAQVALFVVSLAVVAGILGAVFDVLREHWLTVWRALLIASLVAFVFARLSEAGAYGWPVCHPQSEWLWIPTLLQCS